MFMVIVHDPLSTDACTPISDNQVTLYVLFCSFMLETNYCDFAYFANTVFEEMFSIRRYVLSNPAVVNSSICSTKTRVTLICFWRSVQAICASPYEVLGPIFILTDIRTSSLIVSNTVCQQGKVASKDGLYTSV